MPKYRFTTTRSWIKEFIDSEIESKVEEMDGADEEEALDALIEDYSDALENDDSAQIPRDATFDIEFEEVK